MLVTFTVAPSFFPHLHVVSEAASGFKRNDQKHFLSLHIDRYNTKVLTLSDGRPLDTARQRMPEECEVVITEVINCPPCKAPREFWRVRRLWRGCAGLSRAFSHFSLEQSFLPGNELKKRRISSRSYHCSLPAHDDFDTRWSKTTGL